MVRRDGGQTLAEFAMVLPVFFLLVFGTVDFARMIQSYVTIQHSAREGARYAVTGRGDCAAATPSRMDCIEYITRTHADNLTDAAASMDVEVRSWAFEAGGYASTPTEDDAGIQCDNVEVAIEYEYSPIFPMIETLFGKIPLSASERLVNEPFGACGVGT